MNQNFFPEELAEEGPGFIYPTAGSVRGRVLAALLRGEQVTQADALRRWATSRLGSAVYQLRREFGWPIMTTEIEVPTHDNGRLASVARYWLPNHVIQLADARGQMFAGLASSDFPHL